MIFEKLCRDCGKKSPVVKEGERVIWRCVQCGNIEILAIKGMNVA